MNKLPIDLSSPKKDDELPAKSEDGDTTPKSYVVQSFTQKATPGAPLKKRDGRLRRLRAGEGALKKAFKELAPRARKVVSRALDKATEAHKEVGVAMEKEAKAQIRYAEASRGAKKAAAEAKEASDKALKANTEKAHAKAKEAEVKSIKANAEAESAGQLAKEASAEVNRANKAAKDADAEKNDVLAVLFFSEADSGDQNQAAEEQAIDNDGAPAIPVDEVQYRYSDYVSYNRDKDPSYPIKAWTLSENQVACFQKLYLISRNLERDEVIHKIDEILEVNATRIKDEGDFWFDIPKRDVEFLDYCYCLAMPLLRRGHTARRSFNNGRTKHQACMTAWLLNHLREAVKGRFNLTMREIYYNNKMLFRNPDAVAKALTDICCLLECPTTSLNVIPRPEGTVIGKLVLKMSGQTKDVDFSDGELIPFDIREIDQFVMDKSVEFILVVEKGTMYDHLKRVGFHENHKCIIVCGNGVPDERTRGFVRMLEERFDIPIYGITDPDSYGSSIMKVYAKGSINLAHCNMSLATNSIHWLGICTLDIENMGPIAAQKIRRRSAKLKADERKMLRNMRNPNYGLSSLWDQRICHMLYWNRKACFEDLNVLGRDYAASVHIPYLITRVKDNMQQINGNGSPSNSDPFIVPSSEKVPALSFDELKRKTKDFGSDALIDEGPYGRLYCAVLKEGKYMAVKRLNALAGPQPNKEFLKHVNIVSALKHENFVKLLGYCVGGDEHLLVYESATMGSLHDVLHGKKDVAGAEQTHYVLDWNQRVKIAVDAARGLEYLHEKAQGSIIHGDIHSSNILLFGNYKAKISDFKLSNQHPTLDLRNQEYHAPEYATGQLTQKCDVFSFGIVLLELLTGRNPSDEVQDGQKLVSWAKRRIQQGDVLQSVDSQLKRYFNAVEAEKFAEVAVLCLDLNPQSRPSLSTVVNQLSSLGQEPEPSQI